MSFNVGEVRKCTWCGEYKPIDGFWKKCRYCKDCGKKDRKEHYQNNKDSFIERAKEWAKNNIDKRREIARDYVSRNKEKVSKYSKEWNEKNPGKKTEALKRWRKQNPEKVRVQKTNRRALEFGAEGNFTEAEWLSLVEKYEHKCLRCGRDDVKLTHDHVIPLSLGGSNSIDNIQPLCYSCNSSKSAKHIDYRS
jgi:5-methylcytosine-specific restriction endonuclease McrA